MCFSARARAKYQKYKGNLSLKRTVETLPHLSLNFQHVFTLGFHDIKILSINVKSKLMCRFE